MKYSICIRKGGEFVAYLSNCGRTAWSKGHVYRLIEEAKTKPHFAGHTFHRENDNRIVG